MRKVFICLLILVLWVQFAYGAAGDVASVNGKAITATASVGGKANAAILTIAGKPCSDGDAACTTENDSETVIAWATTSNTSISNYYVAQPFTVTSGTYITQFNVRLRDTTATGNTTTCGVYNDATGVPGTLVSGTEKTSAFSTDAWTDVSFVLDAAVLLTGTTFYVKCHSASTGMLWGNNNTGTNVSCQDPNDVDWTCAFDALFSLKWYGCAP